MTHSTFVSVALILFAAPHISLAQSQSAAVEVPTMFSSSTPDPTVDKPAVGNSTLNAHVDFSIADPEVSVRPFSALAVSVSVGTLGPGLQLATPLARRFNLRVGANVFQYGTTLSQDDVNYNAALRMQSGHVSLDWFPFHGGFRISPGYMVYNGLKVKANLAVPGNQSFTINDTDYYSDPYDNIHGNALVTFPTSGPRITIGWGNMIPRDRYRHISIPVELGMVYFGTGTTALNFGGSACSQAVATPADEAIYCQNVTTDPSFQTNVSGEQAKIQKNLTYVRFFPILDVGISYKF